MAKRLICGVLEALAYAYATAVSRRITCSSYSRRLRGDSSVLLDGAESDVRLLDGRRKSLIFSIVAHSIVRDVTVVCVCLMFAIGGMKARSQRLLLAPLS